MRVAAREGGNSSRAELMGSPWNKGNGRWKSDAIMIGRISGTGLPFVCQVTFEKKRAHCLPLTSALQPPPPDFCVDFFFLSPYQTVNLHCHKTTHNERSWFITVRWFNKTTRSFSYMKFVIALYLYISAYTSIWFGAVLKGVRKFQALKCS